MAIQNRQVQVKGIMIVEMEMEMAMLMAIAMAGLCRLLPEVEVSIERNG